MSYRKIEPRMWDDERFAPLTKDAKLTWLCILTGPHTTPLPGLSVCGIATLSESLRDGIDTVSKAVKELSDAGLIRFNPVTRVLQVPNAPKYNPCANQKVLKGWFSLWKGVPDCVEKYAHIARIRGALDGSQAWTSLAWDETFGTVTVPDRYRTDTVSETVSISGAVSGASTGTRTGGGVGEPTPPLDLSPPPSPPVVPTSGAHSTGETGKPTKAKRQKASPVGDTIPLTGTLARKVYDAIASDPVLAAIVAGPGDAATRWSDPDIYPGVDVLAELKRAGAYAAAHPEKRYTDGRRYVGGWLQRKADEVARAPRPLGGATPSAGAPAKPRPTVEEFEALARRNAARAGGVS